ncbi:class I SAM-dependent methyltransferase [Paenibacillus sp. MMS18-CY102]|uniref:class I SAM-dependent methyltransferase n=1 Tax=Paenibacillus sp. MMS18-CY102 TaxID=2682849 RepID=UPI0013652A8C|nr:class I SAM-dependent methyltransferase [Paenibacillus sp. MMS18-CY102]MWC29355.1 methyltransferase domain-containing protein [Paenibacillus sp. MMS18-CY102]
MGYYGELCTRLYESDKSIAEGKELDFYLSFVTNKDMHVLEPMCGNGRMLIPFMQKGITIEGFDLSEDMLHACLEKGKKLNLAPNVYKQRIEAFTSEQQYDLIMIPFGSFSLLPNELASQSLAAMRAALKPEGKLLLTIMLQYDGIQEIPEWTRASEKQFQDETIVFYKKVHYNAEQNLLTSHQKYELVRDGQVVQTEMMDFLLRLYALEEFEQTLASNGFQRIVVHEVKDGYGEGTYFHAFECGIG